ncbi:MULTISPECIES: hypothetical protein [unclassified Kitasatospora]|uniref:hypothetical protein n=1 Tax=unclassified Kitasatospora TaxID=2633591 RepID=UPI00070B40FD|nr:MULTISPECIES: hypothetical protein [unclassified Kitasatospora]KQV09837.1 hypothetical protein ASC99_10515 [Kitasatospora sp. Root107]KRB70076.1 hypothetical protein ASE03_25865 [Kitasatospora sp. Root187]
MSSDSGAGPRRGPRLLTVRLGGGRIGWLLAAANGRQLARSAVTYRSEPELDEAVRQLLVERAALRYLVQQDGDRSWGWSALLPVRSTGQAVGEAVARSARGYLRQDQCRQGMASFQSMLQQLRALRGAG